MSEQSAIPPMAHTHAPGEACRGCLWNMMQEGIAGHAQGVAAGAETLGAARRVSNMYFLRTKDLAAVLLDARGLVRGLDAALDDRIDAVLHQAGFDPAPSADREVEALAECLYAWSGGIHWEGETTWQDRHRDEARQWFAYAALLDVAQLGVPLIADRGALAEALRDYNVPGLAGNYPVAAHWVHMADALLASPVLTTPAEFVAALAEDEAVVEQVARLHWGIPDGEALDPSQGAAEVRNAADMIAALAAALAAPTTEEP